MASYAEGHFDIVVAAINSDVPGRHSNATTRVSGHTSTITPGMGFVVLKETGFDLIICLVLFCILRLNF